MTFDELKDKALTLPLSPGVYVMRDSSNQVIYVGKAKKLKNRVSQYFQDSAGHSPKTRAMVAKIRQFDVIVAASEFEALILECSLIKRYQPRYNILLKDDKGFPYLRLDMSEPYPKITMVNQLAHDGASYFGPYGSRGVTQNLLDTIRLALKLPGCSKQFPRDQGKGRPCLNYHMNHCRGWCQPERTQQEYRQTMEQVKQLLSGNYKQLLRELEQEMQAAAENLEFERAAELRDRRKAVESLGQKQLVTAAAQADTDVVGFAQTVAKSCFVVLHYSGGNLLDKEMDILPYQENVDAAVSSLVKQYYLARGIAPKVVLLPVEMEDGQLFSDLMLQNSGRRTYFRTPKRGDNVQMVELAQENARREAERVTSKAERISGTLQRLGKMLSLDTPPRRLEAFDISNLAGTDIVASMVVFVDGKPDKQGYKRFQVEGLAGQDDYASMRQVVARRFRHYCQGDAGFAEAPDVLLIDGGTAHAEVARQVLAELNLEIPVFGMVKDNKHRTRALVTPAGQEIALDGTPGVFALIGSIQEETHRFAITYNRALRSKRLRHSQLDDIPGIGPKRKSLLLQRFKSISAIAQAGLPELKNILPADAAAAVYAHFHQEES